MDNGEPKVNEVVKWLRPTAEEAAAKKEPPRAPTASETDAELTAGAPSADRRSFEGYLGRSFVHGGVTWQVLYLDWDLQTWLMIEDVGIVRSEKVKKDPGAGTVADRDVVWVKVDAAVGLGKKSLSLEGMFLTGEFTRAGDYDAGPAGGGTLAAGIGGFGGARSPGCCRPKTPRT